MRRIFDPNEPYFLAWTWLEGHDERQESIPEPPTTPSCPPLHLAALYDLDDIANWLITSRSQDPDERNASETALHIASSSGNLKVAQSLIEHGANVNPPSPSILGPLHAASLSGQLEISRLLIKNGADVNALISGNVTALFCASRYGDLEVVRALLESGADPNLSLHLGPLFQALLCNHSEIVQLLLEYGADINAQDMLGNTLLHQAALCANEKAVRQLLELGANIYAKNDQGKTPLQTASASSALETQPEGMKDIVQLLQRSAEGSSAPLDRW